MTPLPPAAEEDTFFRLLRIASGCGGELPRKLTEEEWLRMADLAKRQALGGILMQAVEQLPPADRPPQRILFQWIGWTGKIENVNRRLNSAATAVSLYFKEKGFRPTILKGQGAAETYPNPLRRTPGDIDVWIEGDRKRIFRLARTIDPKAKAVYHHIDMKGLSEEFEVELHTTPSWMNNPFTNRKLQRMFRRWAQENAAKEITLTGAGSVCVPSDEMNRVFLLVHIYRHLMAEGIGLRQLMDYFFLLRKGTDEEARKRFAGQLRELKMMRFAGAVMYVLGRVFGLEERLMPVPPSEKYGGRLLEEIMRAGNFGLYDERIDRSGKDTEWRRFRRRMKRIVRFAADYPDEVCWTPWFKIWHFFWRKAHN